MKKYLFLAEKSSLMKDIKDTYNKHKSDIQAKVGYIDFITLSGHACRLIEPKEYEEWNCSWEDIDLPMIPKPFKIDKINKMNGTIKKIKEAIETVEYDGIIVGTDADIEGNGIYYLLAQYLNIMKMPALRFYLEDQTDKGIYKALTSLTDYYKNPRDVHMTESFLIRSHMDWLIGMNFTVGASVKSGFTMKVGRIKTPTLKLVYDNCKAIDTFVPHTDFAVNSIYQDGFIGNLVEEEIIESESGKAPKTVYNQIRFEDEESAKDFIKKLSKEGKVVSYEKKTQKTKAPLLYSLPDLQGEADAKYHYDPSMVLDIVQSLYETHKIVSYPRTSGNYISEAKAEDFPELIKSCSYLPGLDAYTSKITAVDMAKTKADKNIVNDKEVAKASHDALMPTGKIPDVSKLSNKELNICTMIYKRFLAHFLPVLEEEKVVMYVDVDGNLFKSNGKRVIEKGWTTIFDKKLEEIIIPDYREKDSISIKAFETAEKTTQPPKRFTQGTLIIAMKNAAKYVEDKTLKAALKEAEGLGQPSSRSPIIKNLIKDGYMEDRKGRGSGLYITETGKEYIENLKDYSITSPVLVSEWEFKTKQIRQGDVPYDEVEAEMLEYVKSTVKEIEKSDIKKMARSRSGSTGFTCPVCKANPLIKGKYGWFCGGKKEGHCDFAISEVIAKKKITETNVKQLVEKGITNEIKGFKSSTGKSFAAKLKINEGKIEFSFDEPKQTKAKYLCPCCGSNVISDKWSWKCEKECGFSLSYKIAGKTLKESDLKELIENKKTKKISGFVSKKGKPFNAYLVLQSDGKTKFEF
jgi:DNA topoisomerase-3